MESLSEYAEVLGPATRAAWPTVAQIVPAGTVLMGGTALAMQLRHRRSEDLEWLRRTAPDDFVCGIVLHTGERAYRLGDRLLALPLDRLWTTEQDDPIGFFGNERGVGPR